MSSDFISILVQVNKLAFPSFSLCCVRSQKMCMTYCEGHGVTTLTPVHICLDSGKGVVAPLTAFPCLIPDLWHAQCSLA